RFGPVHLPTYCQHAWRTNVDVVEVGTASVIRNPKLSIAGKTGTAVKDGLWTGWFVSYAPVANPKLAIVVVLQGADTRGSNAAKVAGQIFSQLQSQLGQ
ncbi:MAG TPA: penicillin-binding transpeptidase domain-containing protein, partial [Acidobacteriota bacterium]|nr:penicillin-binding transpeptidase domain-containing protein [Acidobacteriota bacterium]